MAETIYPSEHSYIRDAVDSAGTLPAIHFEPEPIWPFEYVASADSYTICSEAGQVGEAVILRSVLGCRYLTRLRVAEELRGQGLGLAAYVLGIEDAHRHGNSFCNDPLGSYLPAVRMWERLAERGVVKEEEALHPRSNQRGRAVVSGLYVGRVCVPPPSIQEWVLHA